MTKPKTAKAAQDGSPLPGTINFDGGDGTNLPPAKDIHTAILAIMEQVGYVRKTRGANLDYAYAGEQALIAAIRPWMVYYGVYMTVIDIPVVNEVDRPRTNRQGESYGNTRVVSLTSRVRFTHAPSGTFIDTAARGEGADVSDKANNKAETGAYKYALRQTFCIETGLDPDSGSPLVPGGLRTAPLANAAGVAEGGIDPRDPAYIGGDFDQTPSGSPDAPEPPPPADELQPYPPGTVGAALGADPRPPAGPLPPKLARIDVDKDNTDWQTWLKRLIKTYPDYSVKRGKEPTNNVDMTHIRATSASLGFPVVDDHNWKDVLTAISQHAKDKAALFEEPKADGKAEPGKAAPKADDKKAPGTPASKPAPQPGNKQAGGAAKRPSNDEALRKAGF